VIRERRPNEVAAAKPIRLALVGSGRWGQAYLHTLAGHAEFDLVAVVDPSEEALFAAKSIAPCASLRSDSTDLARCGAEAAIVATPAASHARVARELLAMGLDVLVEKPFATELDDAREVAEMAESLDRRVLVGHLPLHHPAVMQGLRIARGSGRSPTRSLHVRTSAGATRGLRTGRDAESTLWALAPHDVALALSAHEGLPLATSCRGVDGSMVEAEVRFEGGAVASFRWSRTSVTPTRSMIIELTHGRVVVD
jgi:predicted dehydrogenase